MRWFLPIVFVFTITLHAQPAAPLTGLISDEQPFAEQPVSVAEGERLTAVMTLGDDLDGYLLLVDEQGNVLAENDATSRSDPNPSLDLIGLEPGNYRLIATRYNFHAGTTTGTFSLSYTLQPTEPLKLDYSAEVTPEALAEAGYPAQHQGREDMAAWTILAYYGADNNLEQAIINDIEEFEMGGGSSADVNVVALLDRSPAYYEDETDDWSGARVFHLQAGQKPEKDNLIETPALFSLGAIDTGSGAALAQFMVWAMRHYPARNYIIAFASHGNGWAGVSQDDESEDRPIIPLSQLDAAFRAGQQVAEAQGARVRLVINDACLMGSMEYFALLSNYADYALASPEVVLSPALDMALLVSTLRANPGLNVADPAALAQPLIARYMADISQSSQRAYMGYALFDLGPMQTLRADLDELAQVLRTNAAAYTTLIGKARAAAYTYSEYAGVTTKTDIGDLVRQMQRLSDDDALNAVANRVLRGLQSTLIYGEAGAALRARTSYQNIFFPANRADLTPAYTLESTLPQWRTLLVSTFNQLTAPIWNGREVLAFHAPVPPEVVVLNTLPVADVDGRVIINSIDGLAVDVQVKGRKISGGVVRIMRETDDGQALLLEQGTADLEETTTGAAYTSAWFPGVNLKLMRWDGRLYGVEGADGVAQVSLRISEDRQSAAMSAQYRPNAQTEWIPVTIIFGEERYDAARAARVRYGTTATTGEDGGGVSSFTMAPGAEVQALDTVIRKGNRVRRVPGALFTVGESGLIVRSLVPDDGDYQVVLEVTNFSGQSSDATQAVTLRNEEPVTAEGYARGPYTVVVPANWSPIIATERGYDYSYDMAGMDVPFTGVQSLYDEYGDLRTDVFSLYHFDDTLYFEDEATCNVLNDFAQLENVEVDNAGCEFAPQDVPFHFGVYFNALDTTPQRFGTLYRGDFVDVIVVYNFDPQTRDPAELPQIRRLEYLDYSVGKDSYDWQEYLVSYARDRGTLPIKRDHIAGLRDTATGMQVLAEEQGARIYVDVSMVGGFTDLVAARQALLASMTAGFESVSLLGERAYYGERYNWEVQLLDFVSEGEAFTGRLYVTTTRLGTTYALLLAVARGDSADDIFISVLEILLDGFQIPDPLRTYRRDDLGLRLNVDRAWRPPQELASGDGLSGQIYATSENKVEQIYIYYERGFEGTAADYVRSLNAVFGFSPIGGVVPGTLNGQRGVYTRYLSLTEGTEFIALGFATVTEDGTALLVAYETTTLVITESQIQRQFDSLVAQRLSLGAAAPDQDQRAMLLWDTQERYFFSVDVPTPYYDEQYFTLVDEETGEIAGSERVWNSPTGCTAIIVEVIPIDFEYAVENYVPLADFVKTETYTETTLGGRYALYTTYEEDYGPLPEGALLPCGATQTLHVHEVVTYAPELGRVVTLRVQGKNGRGAQDALFAAVAQRFAFAEGTLDFNPEDLGEALVVSAYHEEWIGSVFTLTPPEGWSDWQQSAFWFLESPERELAAPRGDFFSDDDEALPPGDLVEIYALQFNMQAPFELMDLVRYFEYDTNSVILGEPQEVELYGMPALIFDYLYEQRANYRTIGLAAALILEEGATARGLVLTGEAVFKARYKAELAFTCALDSVRFDGDEAAPCDWPLTTSQVVDNITFQTPQGTQTIQYFAPDDPALVEDVPMLDVFFGAGPDGTEFYVYYHDGEGTLEEQAQQLLDYYGLYWEELIPHTAEGGFDAFVLSFEAEQVTDQTGSETYTTFGQGILFEANGIVYMVSVEATDEVDYTLVETWFGLLLRSLRSF
jgi:hypothetical protein